MFVRNIQTYGLQMTDKKILLSLFIAGLFIKLFFIISFTPDLPTKLYLPFLESSINSLSFDPWNVWLKQNGDITAFPYGYIMWFALLPFYLISDALGIEPIYGYGLTLIITDILILYLIVTFINYKYKKALIYYWLSPVLIFTIYAMGFNDTIPILFLLVSIVFLKKHRYFYSGVFYTLAVSAKLSMIVLLPIYILYFVNNKSVKLYLGNFLGGVISFIVLIILPFFYTDGIHMLAGNPELSKIYNLNLRLDTNTSLYIVPLVYLLTLYYSWRLERINFDMFFGLTGVLFLIIVLLSPSAPGWFIWTLPFLTVLQIKYNKNMTVIFALLSILYLLLIIGNNYQNTFLVLSESYGLIINFETYGHFMSILQTIVIVIGIILVIHIYKDAIMKNNYFRLKRKPFVIGVTGDSSSGKDTLADSIIDLFGQHSTIKLSGDDYHFWDRKKPMWQVMTHLNPYSNDLTNFSKDLISLIEGNEITKRVYNHSNGILSKPSILHSKEFIISSGLHSLYSQTLRDCCNLKIFLDMDQDLRKYLKIYRDTVIRGHDMEKVIATIDKRKVDSEKYIMTQLKYADLVFTLSYTDKLDQNYKELKPDSYKLTIKTKMSFSDQNIVNTLISKCGLCINCDNNTDYEVIEISGAASRENIAFAAQEIFKDIDDLLDIKPNWQSDMMGIMQIITLSHIRQRLKQRNIQ